MTNVRIYVGTYNKYNNGSIYGKWIDLSNYLDKDELFTAMQELHKDEEDPEFMFQDYECPDLFLKLGLISECHISDNIFNVIDYIESSSYDLEVISAYCNCTNSNNENIEEIIQEIEESYNGEYNTDKEFVQQLLEDCGDIPSNLPSYIHIDWERTAYDVMMDYSTSDNHYFRNL